MAESFSAFPRYTLFDPLVPVWCVTPGSGRMLHRFFDTSPFSPSGRYLGLTRLPFEDRLPRPGDVAEVVVVDVRSGELRPVAETRGWDTQLGAQVQWGVDDTQLFYNDVDIRDWRAFGVKLNPLTGERKALDGTIYMVSPDGRLAASPCLLRTGTTQPGYGVIVPRARIPVNRGASAEDGLYVTDTSSGRCTMLVSLRQIVESARPSLEPDEYADGDFHGFHVKWNASGDRLLFVLRWLSHRQRGRGSVAGRVVRRGRSLLGQLLGRPRQGPGMRRHVITMRADGSDLRVAIPDEVWRKGGHHPNWTPDGLDVMMNLKLDGDRMSFVRVRHDGAGLRAMASGVTGSGHPSLHPDGRHILTDAYPGEPVAFGDGTVPIRLVDCETARERTLVRIHCVPPFTGAGGELRVDPHPAWDRSFRFVAFNACPDGTRRVYVADLRDEVAAGAWATRATSPGLSR